MFLSPGYAAAIPISAGAVVGVALEVRNVITAENDTNLVRRITAKLTNAFVQLKARHSTSQQTLMWRFYFLPGESASGLADYSFMSPVVNLGKYDYSDFDRGAARWKRGLWVVVRCVFFQNPCPWGSAFRSALLRSFGAKIGKGVVIGSNVNIPFHGAWS